MTDEFAFLQFSQKDDPDPDSGYTLDDNARALMVTLSMEESSYPYACLFTRYLMQSQSKNGSWCNLFQQGQFHHTFDSEDSVGRAFLACSMATTCAWNDIAYCCKGMLQRAIPRLAEFTSPRGIAYSLIGLCKGNFSFLPEKYIYDLINLLAMKLLNLYDSKSSRDWKWFEDHLTYCNGILPQALFAVYAFNGDKRCLKAAHESLGFLNELLFAKGYLNIVGNEGWYQRGGKLPVWDQQPVDAASIIFACWEAYQAIGLSEYLDLAHLGHQWYRGRNIHGLALYNQQTGGCYDALTKQGVNLNQGAEAVLSLLLSDLLIENAIIADLPEVISS